MGMVFKSKHINVHCSFLIRKNPQMRKRYDRHEALADPGRAVRRAATDAALQSVVGFGRGLFDVGALAVGAIKNQATATVASPARKNDNSDAVPAQTAAPSSQKLAP
jgi:hypothetical protein